MFSKSYPYGVYFYFYIRDNELCRSKNIFKLGVTDSLKNRNDNYITYEHKKGNFIKVYEIDKDLRHLVDKLHKEYFKRFRNYIDGGEEYYDRNVIDCIDSFFKCLDIKFRELSIEEIECMSRKERHSTHNNTNQVLIQPKDHQQHVLDKIKDFYSLNDIGKIIWACGLGKTLLSLFIIQLLKFKSIIIGVSTQSLQDQMYNEILFLFPNESNILFVGGDNIKSTTNQKKIIEFINQDFNRQQPRFIITTYHSCYLLVDSKIQVDFKIGDESHHLVGMSKDEEKGFRLFHQIQSSKTLFMTATEKIIETRYKDRILYSMDDEFFFGKYIDQKSVQWAIENKKITDYNVSVLKNTEEQIDEIIQSLGLDVNNKELFLSAFMSLKSIEKYSNLTHILLYTNTIEDAELSEKYINDILSSNILSISKDKVYNRALHSKNCKNVNDEILQFTNHYYGIISCVYFFGEGTSIPKLNGVCIASNMYSEIRIVQYLLRPNRLYSENPNKIAYILIPYLDSDDWLTDNKSFEKVRYIISQMRNVDENIEQKMFVSMCLDVEEQDDNDDIQQEENKCLLVPNYILEENKNELNQLKLRLRYSKTLHSKLSEEQDEYNYVRSINQNLKVSSKKEYNNQQKNHLHFIPNPDEYFKSKGVWNGWYDFFGFDTSVFLQSKDIWIEFCKEKKIKSLEGYFMACEICKELPKEPEEFYRDFTNIALELGFRQSRR
jgi:predicted helicase